MTNLNRRNLLHLFGLASVTSLLPATVAATGKVCTAKPGEGRFTYSLKEMSRLGCCKLTSEDTAGALSAFDLLALPRSGPVLHVHHREDEWYYVLSGEFIFKAGDETYTMTKGGSIWLPRGIPHTWANTTKADANLILVSQPGGFEKFFEELSVSTERLPQNSTAAQQKAAEILAKYGMEMLGPPLLEPLGLGH
jgi:mannose-6-phosphate isomerase-like protein (cupin superfamily)